jgi:hypothetical protein
VILSRDKFPFVEYSPMEGGLVYMGYYDVGLICLNGHVVNSSAKDHPEHNSNFCDECGSKTINACKYCDASIRGRYHAGGVFDLMGTIWVLKL